MERLKYEEVKMWVNSNSQCKLLSKEYKNARTKLEFLCKCGDKFYSTFDNFKKNKFHVCRKCSNSLEYKGKVERKSDNEIFRKNKEYVIDMVEQCGFKYITRYTKKETRSTIIEFECPIHGIQKVYWTNFSKRKRCPKCNKYNKQDSLLTLKVGKFLKENNINYLREYKFDECKVKRKLPFDFYLPKINVCIEVQGKQHYKESYFGGWSKEVAIQKLKETKYHDFIKREFCRKNKIKLIEIPYWSDDKEENYKKYLDMITLREVTV